jgi:type II secretory ATPase GspE/PulE/Tfp pilus assembly ATPase PilB-like protein
MSWFGRAPEAATKSLAKVASPAQERGSAQPAANPAVSLMKLISKMDELPSYERVEDLGTVSAQFAALLVDKGNFAYLVIREDQWQAPVAHGTKAVLERKRQYRSVKMLKATATVIQGLQTTVKGAQAAGERTVARAEVHVARGMELISQAIKLDASDIHLEVRERGRDAPRVVVRMRVHGQMRTIDVFSTSEQVKDWTEIVRGLYQNDDICSAATRSSTTWSQSQKQEAMLKPPVRGAELRFESLPEKGGFDVIMRITGYEGKSAARRSLSELGLSDDHVLDLQRAADAPHGLIVVVGATGSGKTTTVTTTLALDDRAEFKKRLSLEMPPEADIPWLSQLVVTEDTLRSIMDGVMRADPDIISGGEVRNKETGQMAQDFSITGHLTWVTVHANGAFLAIRRLLSDRLGFDLDILTMRNYLRACLYQALVEKLCQMCARPAGSGMSDDRLELLQGKFGLDSGSLRVRHIHQGPGQCAHCRGNGLSGLTVVAELLVPSVAVLALVAEKRLVEAERVWRMSRTAKFNEPGTQGKTYIEHALYKASQGLICADGLFTLENLWTYEVMALSKPEGVGTAFTGIKVVPHIKPSQAQL